MEKQKLKWNKGYINLALYIIILICFFMFSSYLEYHYSIKNLILLIFICFSVFYSICYFLSYYFQKNKEDGLASIIKAGNAILISLLFLYIKDSELQIVFYSIVISMLSDFLCIKITGVNPDFSSPIDGYLRSILELAGKQVHDIRNGYTERPYPVGKVDFTKDDLLSFTFLLEKKGISKHFVENGKLNLIFSHGFYNPFPLLKPKFEKLTYIEFDYSGNMSVHIAKKDYEKYKEELTFDQLCQSLGHLILQFFELYKQGNEAEILKMLKVVK